MAENTLSGSGGLRHCANNAPDGLDYEPVIRSGHYLAGQEGFEPSTIRLTAERTTAVLLTQNAKSPERLTQGLSCLAALFAFAPEHT